MSLDIEQQINNEQMITFFKGYDFSFRLSKILSIKMSLINREVLKEELQNFYDGFINVDDQYVYGSFTNGLIFSAISELLMQIEDFLSLSKFIRDNRQFVKGITFYSPKKVLEVADKLIQLDRKQLLHAFFVPDEEMIAKVFKDVPNEQWKPAVQLLNERSQLLQDIVHEIVKSYKKYEFFYNQYKHGLTVALKPYSGEYTEEEINRRKSELTASIVSYDNDTLERMEKTGRLKSAAFVIPNLTHTLQPFLSKLMEERNLLRYHTSSNVDIDDIIDISRKICLLNMILISNRLDYASPHNEGIITISLPSVNEESKFMRMEIKIVQPKEVISFNDFNVVF